MRRRIAWEAARLMYTREESEYFRAKMKAARRIFSGDPKPSDLPSNREIRDQIQAFARMHESERRDDNLRDMRVEALRLMRLLRPVVRVLGLGRRAAPLTVTGMLLGLTYGGGLLIDEARSGELSPRAIFFSLALLSLCHSVIEDTLLMGVLGAHLSGILWARLAVAVAGVAVLVRVLRPLDERTFVRYLCRARALR